MRFAMNSGRALIAAIAMFVAVLGLCAGGNEPTFDVDSPLSAAAEAMPSADHARAIYDGRTQRAEAEVIRTDNPCPNGVCPFQNAVSKIHAGVNQAQGEAMSGVTVVRYRHRERSGPIFPNRPKLFRGR